MRQINNCFHGFFLHIQTSIWKVYKLIYAFSLSVHPNIQRWLQLASWYINVRVSLLTCSWKYWIVQLCLGNSSSSFNLANLLFFDFIAERSYYLWENYSHLHWRRKQQQTFWGWSLPIALFERSTRPAWHPERRRESQRGSYAGPALTNWLISGRRKINANPKGQNMTQGCQET